MATGQPLDVLLDADEAMLATLAEAYEEGWTRVEHLLAAVIDAVNASAYNALVGPHVDPKKLRRVKPPAPLPRPGQRRKRRRANPAETGEFFRQVLG